MHTELYYTEDVSDHCKKLFFHNGKYLGDLVLDVDGYWKLFPVDNQGGYWDEFLLKTLGEYLASMNNNHCSNKTDTEYEYNRAVEYLDALGVPSFAESTGTPYTLRMRIELLVLMYKKAVTNSKRNK